AVPATTGSDARGAHRAIGTAIRRQLEQRLPAVLVHEVPAEIVDGDEAGEQRVAAVCDLAPSLDGSDAWVAKVRDEATDHVGSRPMVGGEDDENVAGGRGA